MEFLRVTNLKKSFGEKEVLTNLNFNLYSGEIVGLIGKSGCGKSVFLNILGELISPDSGKIFFKGMDLYTSSNLFKKNIGFVFQENTLFDDLTIKENSLYFGKLYGIKKEEIIKRINELSDLLDLSWYLDTKTSQLSGGTIRRANILVSLIHSPDLLILDEPSVGLDFISRKNLLDYIKKINKERGISIIFISHILEEVEYLCDRVCILNNGKIILDSSIDEIRKKYSKDLSSVFEEVINHENN